MTEEGVKWELKYEAAGDYGNRVGVGVTFVETVPGLAPNTRLVSNSTNKRVIIEGHPEISVENKRQIVRDALVQYLSQVIGFIKSQQ